MFKGIKNWLEIRIGLGDLSSTCCTENRVPKNITVLSALGFVVLIGFVIEVISGIFLLIYYVPHTDHAFQSVQDIMSTVPYGWLFRQVHVVGSNLLIAAVLLHMITVFFMGNYKRPRELTWFVGGLMLIVAFLFGLSGYLLPWSQLSYWATTMVTSMVRAIPFAGDFIVEVLRGDDNVSGETLSRFFALHVGILPLVFLILVYLHIFLIRRIGLSATPFGASDIESRQWTEFKKKSHPDGYPYYPQFFYKQISLALMYCAVLFFIITFFPTLFLPIDATTPADPFKTPLQVRPEWYFLAQYQLLKLIPNKFLGITLEIILVGIFLLWPLLDTYKEKNVLKRPILRGVFVVLAALWVVLMYWGRF